MPKKADTTSNKIIAIVVICAIVVGASVFGLWFWKHQKSATVSEKPPADTTVPIKTQSVIDYAKIEKDKELKSLMEKRKEAYGVDKGIDMIATSDESIKVGESTVSMQEIAEKMQLKAGDIVEKHIGDVDAGKSTEEFGIYIVQKGDNIWNVHFDFLQDYFAHRGVTLSPRSDEPNARGYSSGVGKVLKFSEKTVYIYNLQKEAIDIDLNIIHPLSKLVIYHMERIFSLLDQIDYENVDHIEFDGEMLWIPSE